MDEYIEVELVHLTCPNCTQINTLSYGSLQHDPHPKCIVCGHTIPVNMDAAEQDANRKAHELDLSEDALGSFE